MLYCSYFLFARIRLKFLSSDYLGVWMQVNYFMYICSPAILLLYFLLQLGWWKDPSSTKTDLKLLILDGNQ